MKKISTWNNSWHNETPVRWFGIWSIYFKTMSYNSIDSYSFLRLRLKNPAHSVHVFLLPTQKTAEMPTINVIRYFIINKANSGRLSVFAYKKVINKNFSDTFKVEKSLHSQCKTWTKSINQFVLLWNVWYNIIWKVL